MLLNLHFAIYQFFQCLRHLRFIKFLKKVAQFALVLYRFYSFLRNLRLRFSDFIFYLRKILLAFHRLKILVAQFALAH